MGGLCLAKQAKSGAAEPHEICSSSCTKCEWNSATNARKKTDFVQEINNASLINHTLITRCPPSQPLCNLWTSLLDFYVRRACAVTFCTCSERRSSYPDIFSSTQGAVRPKRLLCQRQRLRSSIITVYPRFLLRLCEIVYRTCDLLFRICEWGSSMLHQANGANLLRMANGAN